MRKIITLSFAILAALMLGGCNSTDNNNSCAQPVCAKKGNVVWLNRIGARHFQIAGPDGAIVTEYGAFHSGDGVKFTNPGVKF